MKALARFVVKWRHALLIVMTVIVVACAALALQVPVNTDMTKYLSESSPMKIGLDIMEEIFGDTGSDNTIRVMAEGLTEEQEAELLAELEALDYVDSVDHDESDTYHNGDYVFYVLHTSYDYNSEEELAIESALDSDFDAWADYGFTWHDDNTADAELTIGIIAAALIILFIVLLLMCASWMEPIVFLLCIGYAVIINAGTNIVLGEVSYITNEIAAILQLVLSMDYSVMVMDRYRQEKARCASSEEAMVEALSGAFKSVAGSSITTFVGLLALTLMSFTIGRDLGLVLAKGVLCSLFCSLTVLPAFILVFDKAIDKTPKPMLRVPTGGLASFSYKFRHALVPVFAVLFVAFLVAQQYTNITYTISSDDPISEVFDTTETLVVLYDTDDEDAVAEIVEELEETDGVTQVLSYPSLLGAAYTADELADAIDELADTFGMEIDEEMTELLDGSMLAMVYYLYAGGEAQDMTMSAFLEFLAQDVLADEELSDLIDADVAEEADRLLVLASAEALTEELSVAELADFFGMDEDTVLDLVLYYYIENGGADAGTMTLSTFASFVLDEVAEDEDYGDLFDEDTLAELEQLATYTDAETVQAQQGAVELADALGLDEETVELLLVYYFASSEDYEPDAMTVGDFVAFLQSDVLSNEAFASYVDEDSAAQIEALAAYTDAEAVAQELTAAELAAALGMDESLVETVMALYFGQDAEGVTMDLATFVEYVSAMAENELFAASFDEETLASLTQMSAYIEFAASGMELTSVGLASVLGMDSSFVEQLLMYYSLAVTGDVTAVTTMTLADFLSFLVDNVMADETYAAYFDEATVAQLTQLNTLVQLAASGQGLDAATMAQAMGMDADTTALLYQLYAGQTSGEDTLSLYAFIHYLADDLAENDLFAAYLDEATLAQLVQVETIMDAAVAGEALDVAEMAALLGFDEETARMIYTYAAAENGALDEWTLSLVDLVDFLLEGDEDVAAMMDADSLAQLKTASAIMHGTLDETAYTPAELAELLGMEEEDLNQLYLLYVSRHGDTSSWQLSIHALVDFLAQEVLGNDEYADLIDEDSQDELVSTKAIIDAVLGGETYSAAACAELMAGLSGDIDETTVELLYLYYASGEYGDESVAISIDDLFTYIAEVLLDDARFDAYIDDEMREQILSLKDDLDEGVEMLRSADYSRLILYTTLPTESEETTAFLDELYSAFDGLDGEAYVIGNMAMAYEMQQDFRDELNFIMLVTALGIFVVVLLTFRSIVVPLLLVLMVQCGVYITVTIAGVTSSGIYYLALLIVECILMGATIDYGILFANYYRDIRRGGVAVPEALAQAYRGSIQTILTSGLIMIFVTGILSFLVADVTISQIVRVVSMGALCAVLLILFVLPGVLAALDRFVVGKKYLQAQAGAQAGEPQAEAEGEPQAEIEMDSEEPAAEAEIGTEAEAEAAQKAE